MCKRVLGLTTLIIFALSGCAVVDDVNNAFPDFSFSANTATIKMLFEHAGPFLHQENERQYFTVYCGVFEGIHCFYLEHATADSYDGMWEPAIDNDPSRQIDRAIAREMFNFGGWKYVEHSKNNAVKVRCRKPANADEPLFCEVDRGGGWERLPVRAG